MKKKRLPVEEKDRAWQAVVATAEPARAVVGTAPLAPPMETDLALAHGYLHCWAVLHFIGYVLC